MKTSPEVALTEKNCLKSSEDSSTGFPSRSTAVMGSTISNVRPERRFLFVIRKEFLKQRKPFEFKTKNELVWTIFFT